jgi:hypothetical protein
VDIVAGDAVAANDDDAVDTVVPPSWTKDEDAYNGASVAFEGTCVGSTVARPLGSLATRGSILSFFTAVMLRRYLKESLEILCGGLRPSTSNN